MNQTEPKIEIRGLKKHYGELEVLRGLDLDVPEGQVVSIIGPSGSGKSTLLRLLMTLEKPDGGDIRIDGDPLFFMTRSEKQVPADQKHLRWMRRKIGMVFQHFNLFPHMTVMRNITAAPLHVLEMSKADAQERALKYLRLVGLEDKVDEYPARLSGGQKQRVAIARALALEPEIMLFDEITSALDPELVGGILELIEEIAAEENKTMMIVTHQMKFAQDAAHRTLFFDHGVILEDGTPGDIFTNPKHERTQEFLQSILNA